MIDCEVRIEGANVNRTKRKSERPRPSERERGQAAIRKT
jgi:hypothetical protein